MKDLEFATAGKIVDALLMILVADVVPGDGQNGIHDNVDRHVIRVAVLVAVHRSDHTFARADKQSGWSVYVIRPAGYWLLPDWNYNTWPEKFQFILIVLVHSICYEIITF